jgi:hypothetical protein
MIPFVVKCSAFGDELPNTDEIFLSDLRSCI